MKARPPLISISVPFLGFPASKGDFSWVDILIHRFASWLSFGLFGFHPLGKRVGERVEKVVAL